MAKVEDLYGKKAEAKIEVMGVEFKVRILPGLEYLDLISTTTDEKGMPSRVDYAKQLIEKCVVEPKVNVAKLDATPLVLLLGKLEELHGAMKLGELVKK